jgi:3-deoxy-manno-octulosonate cytidylyltransferase (CMP-KDO synthetase)
VAAVIPARYASSRFPGKPLALLRGRPMVQHVYERACASGAFSAVLVATDDPRIAEAVRRFGGPVRFTSAGCASGTDRVAEVARAFPAVSAWVNVQGDEPLVDPAALSALAGALSDPGVELATLVRPLEEEERQNPNVVKAVLALDGHALYFSRAEVPFAREGGPVPRWAHVGLYGYRRDVLERLSRLPPSPLEQVELLEQLRALEHGIRIRCLPTSFRGVGVDTPADLARAEALLGTP